MRTSDFDSNSDAFLGQDTPFLGPELLYSTYLGGGGYHDEAVAIAVDSIGNVSVTGKTNSL